MKDALDPATRHSSDWFATCLAGKAAVPRENAALPTLHNSQEEPTTMMRALQGLFRAVCPSSALLCVLLCPLQFSSTFPLMRCQQRSRRAFRFVACCPSDLLGDGS